MPIRIASIKGLKLATIGKPTAFKAKAAAATLAARPIPGSRALGLGFGMGGGVVTGAHYTLLPSEITREGLTFTELC